MLKVRSVFTRLDMMAYKPSKYQTAWDYIRDGAQSVVFRLWRVMKKLSGKFQDAPHRQMSDVTTTFRPMSIRYKTMHPRWWSRHLRESKVSPPSTICEGCMRPLAWFCLMPQQRLLRQVKLIETSEGTEERVVEVSLPGNLCPDCLFLSGWDEPTPKDQMSEVIMTGSPPRALLMLEQAKLILSPE
jgi:hypothetical protein